MNALKTYYERIEKESDEKARKEYEALSEEEKKAIHKKTIDLLSTMNMVNNMVGGSYSK